MNPTAPRPKPGNDPAANEDERPKDDEKRPSSTQINPFDTEPKHTDEEGDSPVDIDRQRAVPNPDVS